jgi:hypothetical protein
VWVFLNLRRPRKKQAVPKFFGTDWKKAEAVTKWLHSGKTKGIPVSNKSQVIDYLVGRGRFELPTNGLKVRCSTG